MLSTVALLLVLTSPSPSAGRMPMPQPTPLRLATIQAVAQYAVLTLQVARTQEQLETGLMWVTALPKHAGMIFVFPADGTQSFWMKDTLIPLDMVFVAADGTVRKVFANVPVVSPSLPDAKIPLETADAKYVIELPAREAALDGIAQGLKIELPLK